MEAKNLGASRKFRPPYMEILLHFPLFSHICSKAIGQRRAARRVVETGQVALGFGYLHRADELQVEAEGAQNLDKVAWGW